MLLNMRIVKVVQVLTSLVLVRYVGDQKKKIDRFFVKWCCKSARPLSMGETDPHFREFMVVATCGKYIPPCKKVAQAELITCAAMSHKNVQQELHQILNVDGLDLSISGRYPIQPIFYFYYNCLLNCVVDSQEIFGERMESQFLWLLRIGFVHLQSCG
jgi:hypothetical protein